MKKLWLLIGKLGYVFTRPGVYVLIRFTRRAYVVIRVKDEIIVTKDWLDLHKNWRLPGGGVKSSETPEQGAIREVKEEVNINIKINQLKLVKKGIHPQMKYKFWIYQVILKEKPNIKINKYELSQACWYKLKNIKKQPKVHELTQYLS